MHPSASFTNTRPGSLKPKIESFSSSYQVPDRFTVNKTTTPSRGGSFRKSSSKSKSDLSIIKSLQSKALNSKKSTPRNIFPQSESYWKSSQSIETTVNEFRPSVLPQYPKDPTQVIYGSKTSHLKVHLRNQSQYISSKSKDDENPTVNKIPHSPISMKRAISPQMLGSIDDYTDTDNLYTENSTFESGDLREPHHIHFPSYPIKNGSINFTKIKPVQESITNTTLNVTPHDFHSFSSLNDITNARGAQCIRMSANIETGTENLYSIQKMEGFQKAFQREELPSMSYRPPTEVNNNDKSSPTKVVCSSMNSGIKNGELKSPGRVRRDQVSLSLKTKPSPIKDFDQGGAKTSNKAILQTSPPKGRFTSVPTENKNSSTFDGVKTYFNKLNKFDLSKSTSIIRHIFQPKKRLKCSCDINLDENETCSKALAWIKKKYNPNEFSYLKSTYEKILSDGKLVEVEYARQIQKDLPRTSPQNKYFAENSEGIKSLENVLNTFAKYDPQIGYVQGMNFIAASLLYHAEEYIAFWLLVMIFEIFEMRDIYLPKLPGLSKHCQIIDMLIFNYQPSIYLHLCQHEIKVEVFCTEWILALFASVIPVENMANFYDILLTEGWPFFYKIIYAFLQHFEKQIKAEDDLMGILTVLKSQNHIIKNSNKSKNPLSIDWNQLFHKAQKIEIDTYFIYKMHSNFDVDNQWFRTSFLDNK